MYQPASIILPAQVNNQIKLIDFEAFLLPTRKSHHRVAVSCMNIIILLELPPAGQTTDVPHILFSLNPIHSPL